MITLFTTNWDANRLRLEKLLAEAKQDYVTVDIDKDPDMRVKYSIRLIPLLAVVENDALVKEKPGYEVQTVEDVTAWLKE